MREHPLNTRKGRAQALLRLSAPLLERLSQTSPLCGALDPFRCKSKDAFSVTAFIHSFGCLGPTEQQWHALFASAGALRPEDLSVLIAHVSCPDNVEHIVFGSPGILDHVCRLWDQWLVDETVRMTNETVEAEASQWGLVKSTEGLVWKTDARRDVSTKQCSLAQSVDTIGMTIVKQVTRNVVEQVLDRVSLGGQQAFMEMLAGRVNALVDMALARAKTVLVENVFQAAAERTCYTV